MAPSPLAARRYHTMVWTGNTTNTAIANKVLIWGGYTTVPVGDGAIYDPATNSWTTMSASTLPAMNNPNYVWSGSSFYVAFGQTPSATIGGFGAYDPATDSWTYPTTTGAPAILRYGAFAWTSRGFINWGGAYDASTLYTTDAGGIYQP